MEQTKLVRIIEQKNERLENDAICTAAMIIESIAKEQRKIEDSKAAIAALREELAVLEVKQLDPAAILG